MRQRRLPLQAPLSPHELAATPELAPIAIVLHALAVLDLALLGAHPELIADEPHPGTEPLGPPACRADAVRSLTAALTEALRKYRAAIREPSPYGGASDDIDF